MPEALRMFEEVDILIFGAILVTCMIFMPDGIAGATKIVFKRVTSKRGTSAHG